MALTRRNFLGLAAAGSTALLTGSNAAGSSEEPFDCRESYAVLVDTVNCIGCRKCEAACSRQNKLNAGSESSFEDKSVLNQHRRPHEDAYTVVNRFSSPDHPDKSWTMKVQCMHCNQPACVSACIVGALTKTENGPVVYDAWKCIGCRYCMIACPFQIPAYQYHNALDPQIRKCTFCADRLAEGQTPACVSICPNEAMIFGQRERLIAAARARIKTFPDRYVDHIYGEHEIGGTAWMYLAPIDFANTELPKLPVEPIPERTEKIQHGIFKSFVPPLALYGLLGLIMHSLRDKPEGEEVES